MFGRKARRLKVLETIHREEGEYLEAARTIFEVVEGLEHHEPDEYDELLDGAFAGIARQAAQQYDAKERKKIILAKPHVSSETVSGFPDRRDLRFKVTLRVGQCVTGLYCSAMGAMFAAIEALQLSSTANGVGGGKLAVEGAIAIAGTYITSSGFRHIAPLAEQMAQERFF